MAWVAEQVLTAIKDSDMRECITEERLIDLTTLTKRQVQESCRRLCHSGLLVKSGEGCHTVTPAGLEALAAGAHYRSGPKDAKQNGKRLWKNTLRIRVWRAIRIRRKFTVPEIITLVVDENARGDITSNVQKYVRALAKAGYLIEMAKREQSTAITSNGYKRWWLSDAKDTGPLAPVLRTSKSTVFDPNTNEEVAI
ncbi:MAG: hypothetical protein C0406_04460 [Sideroxydans sp.]|nr:hypothetical protein [Sideroxydans sp.]